VNFVTLRLETRPKLLKVSATAGHYMGGWGTAVKSMQRAYFFWEEKNYSFYHKHFFSTHKFKVIFKQSFIKNFLISIILFLHVMQYYMN
jgi:hypothetical protein